MALCWRNGGSYTGVEFDTHDAPSETIAHFQEQLGVKENERCFGRVHYDEQALFEFAKPKSFEGDLELIGKQQLGSVRVRVDLLSQQMTVLSRTSVNGAMIESVRVVSGNRGDPLMTTAATPPGLPFRVSRPVYAFLDTC